MNALKNDRLMIRLAFIEHAHAAELSGRLARGALEQEALQARIAGLEVERARDAAIMRDMLRQYKSLQAGMGEGGGHACGGRGSPSPPNPLGTAGAALGAAALSKRAW